MKAKNAPDLELDVDESFQRNEWRFQRLGWVVWALILVAGAAGLLGHGFLSDAVATSADETLTVAYDRFVHYHRPTQLEVSLTSAAAESENVQVRLSRSLLDRLQIERIEPEPERTELADDGVTYSFRRDQGAAGKIVFFVDYERFGKCDGSIQIVGHAPAILEQFIYP